MMVKVQLKFIVLPVPVRLLRADCCGARGRFGCISRSRKLQNPGTYPYPKVHGLWKEFLSFLRLGWIRGHLLGFQNHMSRGILELSCVSTVWHEAREVGGWPANSPIESKQALSSDGEMLEAKGRKRFPKWMSSRNGWFRILYNNYHSLAFHFAF